MTDYTDLVVFLGMCIFTIVSLGYYAHKSPKTKLIGIKGECCKTGMAIRPVYEDEKTMLKILYWQCIHCKRIFEYVTIGKQQNQTGVNQ